VEGLPLEAPSTLGLAISLTIDLLIFPSSNPVHGCHSASFVVFAPSLHNCPITSAVSASSFYDHDSMRVEPDSEPPSGPPDAIHSNNVFSWTLEQLGWCTTGAQRI